MYKEIGTVVYTTMSDNVGQIKVQEAKEEIRRLESQEPGSKWVVNFCKTMMVIDESDEDMSNSTELSKDHCWIIRSN